MDKDSAFPLVIIASAESDMKDMMPNVVKKKEKKKKKKRKKKKA